MATKTKKLAEAELVNQQTAPEAAQPAAPEEMAQAQQQVQAPIEPAGTDPAADVSTPTEPQMPVAGMNDDGTFTPPAPGMVPVGWANPADLAAAVAMATGDAEAAATAPDAQVTEEPVVSPDGQAAIEQNSNPAAPQDPNALTPEDQGMMESLTHADFELLREYKRYREEKDSEDAILAQNRTQEDAAELLADLGDVRTAFKDADIDVGAGAKCIEISSSEPLSKKAIEGKLNAAGFALVSFLPGIDTDNEENFLTKIEVSRNGLETGGLKEFVMKEMDESEKTDELQESAEGQDKISGEAGKEVAKEMDALADKFVQPAIDMNNVQEKSKVKKETLSESLKRLFREAEAIPESPEDIPAASEEANTEDDLLGTEEADVSGLFQDGGNEGEEGEIETDESSLEADLAAIFDQPAETGEETGPNPDPEPMPEVGPEPEGEGVVQKAADVLRVAADHLEDIAANDAAEAEAPVEDEGPDMVGDEEGSPEVYDFGDEAEKPAEEEPAEKPMMQEKTERIPVKLPERPFAKQDLPRRQQLKVREQIQYPAGSNPNDNLVEAYKTVVDARHAAVIKFREALQASKKPVNPRFTEALRTPVKSIDVDENPRSWASNRFEEKAQRLEALDYKKLLREGFLG